MPKKAEKSNEPHHIERAALLKAMRKSTRFTQADFAELLFISRSTVVAIENNYKVTSETLEQEILERWWAICRPYLSGDMVAAFQSYVLQRYGF